MNKYDFSRKLPIGIQDFEDLRKNGYLYVDKTENIYRLVHSGKPYFLSRPRRFGKSLFLSTLKAYWQGKKELFKGLVIEELEADDPDAWQEYPVFYFDFNKENYTGDSALEDVLGDHLEKWEEEYDINNETHKRSLAARFQNLLVEAKNQTGKNSVVLVDEYDKPLLETDHLGDIHEHNREVFKGFFSTLKSYDGYLKFVFLTGVTKFSKVSIFSDLNHLEDISLDNDYSGICGITEEELESVFETEVKKFSKTLEISYDEGLMKLKKRYDGYHFSKISEGVYNPFSLINALKKKELGDYWFETGTPSFLVKRLRKTGFDPRSITDNEIFMGESELMDYRTDNPNPVPLLYQSGYLTIKGMDKYGDCKLGYPNEEVKHGFIKNLASMYLSDSEEPKALEIVSFLRDLDRCDTDSIRDRFISLYASLPYAAPRGDYEKDKLLERDFQIVIYLVFMLMGQYVKVEPRTAKGRADMVVEMDDYVYIFEFKRDGTTDEALQQIEDGGYALAYKADRRQIVKIGAVFDSEKKELVGWEVKE